MDRSGSSNELYQHTGTWWPEGVATFLCFLPVVVTGKSHIRGPEVPRVDVDSSRHTNSSSRFICIENPFHSTLSHSTFSTSHFHLSFASTILSSRYPEQVTSTPPLLFAKPFPPILISCLLLRDKVCNRNGYKHASKGLKPSTFKIHQRCSVAAYSTQQ